MSEKEIKMAASHPCVPRPANDELARLATEVCHAIEACGASSELTHAVSLASDLVSYLRKPEGFEVVEVVPEPTQAPASAPSVTIADIDENIIAEFYFTGADGVRGTGHLFQTDKTSAALSKLTFCVLVLRNGFTVTGESACLSPENFDAEKGKQYAREHAIEKLWPLMGYALKEKLARK